MDLEALATPTTNAAESATPVPSTNIQDAALGAFEQLTTNAKGLSQPVRLAPCTAFVGENRTRKTAYLDGIRLALTGKHPAPLAELRPNGTDRLEARLEGSILGAMQFVQVGKSRADPPALLGKIAGFGARELEHLLPTVSIGNLLRHGSTKGREAIFERFVALDGVPAPQGMTDEQRALWDAAVQEVGAKRSDPTEILTAVRSWMNSLKLRKSKDLKMLEEQLEALKHEVAALGAGSEELPYLEERRRQAATWESQAQTRQSLEREEALFAQLKVEAAALNERTTRLEEQRATLAALEAKITDVIAMMRETAGTQKAELENYEARLKRVAIVEDFLSAMIAHNVHQCPVCLTHGIDAAALLPDKQALRKERQEFVEMAQKDYATTARGINEREVELQRARAAFQGSAADIERAKTDLRNRGAACKSRLDALREALAEIAYEGPTSLELDAKIDALRTADHKRAQVEDLTKSVRQTRRTHEAARELEKEAKALLQDLTRQAKAAAEAAVNKYMPDGFVAELDLEGNNCEWRVVGSDGRPHVRDAMAGSERGALIIALALAWSEGAPIRILLLDDEDIAGFSKVNLAAFLTKVKAHVETGTLTQAFVAWSRPDEIPADWYAVRT